MDRELAPWSAKVLYRQLREGEREGEEWCEGLEGSWLDGGGGGGEGWGGEGGEEGGGGGGVWGRAVVGRGCFGLRGMCQALMHVGGVVLMIC